ncbi:MAG: GtrA family protein [Paludibacteraceae bacterium]|nr:GtrA family protein [Paludibacteraceae bacterium]MBN2786993.1 GtrA family protein [Paludibacteraceae bacterium]
MHNKITLIIDFFYPPFKKFMPISFFRYLSCGGLNVIFDWVLFFIFFHYIFNEQVADFGIIAFKPHIAAFLFTFPITLLSGFYLSKYVSFQNSTLKGRIQLFRYIIVVIGCLLINYICLKLFVDVWHFFPTPSKMITTIFTTIFSYLMQKNFTFKITT